MGLHPNTLLIAVLTPDGLSRKTMRDIQVVSNYDEDDKEIHINGEPYYCKIMELDWDENFQIRAAEGDLIFFEMVTYGYGEFISWMDLNERRELLENWCKEMCKKFKCSYEIRVSSNYW